MVLHKRVLRFLFGILLALSVANVWADKASRQEKRAWSAVVFS